MPDDHRDPARAGSVGRPLPGVEVRVVDPATGNDVEPGTVGELWVNTAQNVTEGWLHTGDLARQDSDGYIFPSGRLSDTINRGGEKFGPIEVEEALRTHPAVATSRSPGSPTRKSASGWGPRWWLSAPVTLEELRSHCRDLIAYFKLPERLAIVDQIPYSATGKVSRRQIAALIARQRLNRGSASAVSSRDPQGGRRAARTSSRPPTARAGCPRWRSRTTLGCSGTPTMLTAPGCPTTSSPSRASSTAPRGRRLARRAQTGDLSPGCANWTTCATT